VHFLVALGAAQQSGQSHRLGGIVAGRARLQESAASRILANSHQQVARRYARSLWKAASSLARLLASAKTGFAAVQQASLAAASER